MEDEMKDVLDMLMIDNKVQTHVFSMLNKDAKLIDILLDFEQYCIIRDV